MPIAQVLVSAAKASRVYSLGLRSVRDLYPVGYPDDLFIHTRAGYMQARNKDTPGGT